MTARLSTLEDIDTIVEVLRTAVLEQHPEGLDDAETRWLLEGAGDALRPTLCQQLRRHQCRFVPSVLPDARNQGVRGGTLPGGFEHRLALGAIEPPADEDGGDRGGGRQLCLGSARRRQIMLHSVTDLKECSLRGR